MLPNPQNAPARLPQGLIHQPVTGLVRGQFAPPERAIVLWLGRVFGAGMPEAAVHENCQPCLQKNEIRFAEHVQMTPPAGDFVPTQQFCQRQFRVLVPARADA